MRSLQRLLFAALSAAVAFSALGCVRVQPSAPPAPRTVPLSPDWHPPKTPPPTSRTSPEPQDASRPSTPALPRETLFAVQCRLDRAGCSPGGIDGRWGPKSTAALSAWQSMKGLPPTGDLDPETLRRLGSADGLWTTYAVTEEDHAALRPFPASWTERAALDTLGFSTIREAVAERFHLYESALVQLNPDASWPNPPAGTLLKVPDLRASSLPPVQRLEILVGDKLVRAYDANDRLVAQFPCSIAANRSKRPVGRTLRVGACADRPEYTFDPALFADDPNAAGLTRRLRIPPGPNNPVGLAWIGLDLPGYGIHGTPAPEKISHTESHGCFRLTNWDARRLLRAIRTGTPVEILP